MEYLDMNTILQRQEQCIKLKTYVDTFYHNPNKLQKRGLYIFGKSGIGKTSFVKRNLLDWNYDVIMYDASESRNKSVIETITNSNLSSVNILSALNKEKKQIVLVMDEIDGMNNGDRGGITSLIKLIRTKKSKKQLNEPSINIPIICIGICHSDKKINELKKVCDIVELLPPTQDQMMFLMKTMLPTTNLDFLNYVECDLRKFALLCKLQSKENQVLTKEDKCFLNNDFNYSWHSSTKAETDIKMIVTKVLTKKTSFSDHEKVINDNDRTIVGLLYHENIVDIFEKLKNSIPQNILINAYILVLSNFCFADYIDRIIFQKQIWQLNEMSSLIKTFYNSHIIDELCKKKKISLSSVRFTKILTKYSTEYNNASFINDITQTLMLDKQDVISFFMYIQEKLSSNQNKILHSLSTEFDVSNLDALRMYRYIDKFINTNTKISGPIDDDPISD